MRCKHIQEIIITDYIDGQLGNDAKSRIDQHLSHCLACQNYLKSVRTGLVRPFNNASKDVPDAVLWSNIREAINEKNQLQIEQSLRPDFWERLRSSIHIPRPAFALASIVTIIFMIGSSGQLFLSSPVMNINGQDQVAYMSSLIDDPTAVDANKASDYQTPIEKYFL